MQAPRWTAGFGLLVRGIATKLMDAVENAANAQSQRTLSVQSSVTAKAFYAKRGFKTVREGSFGEEPTILMSKIFRGRQRQVRRWVSEA
ncbi:GNAT family N-acetyltransferase [Bradyrhizobium sp. AUGA SZCCT0240]|uniref:GNAT family N-acetyltransferase n=1 Tax=Bradyrhizobium sp. AUGA SZCCT0240 TaxID=2807669 RepID=UPI0039089670